MACCVLIAVIIGFILNVIRKLTFAKKIPEDIALTWHLEGNDENS